jgi:hypothetical protein
VRTNRVFLWLLAAFAAYAIVYIFRMSFVVDGVRYFTLADDQMISMRYAENLASGFGLVWNRGSAPIEGFTNFLWVLYMAVFHKLGVPRPWISGCIQFSGAAFLLLNLVWTRRLADHLAGIESGAGVLAAILTAFYIPLDNWAFQGTEVSVLTLVVTAIAYLAVTHEVEGPPIKAWLLAAAATLVRPDAVVIAAALAAGVVVTRPSAWKRNLVFGMAIIAATLIAETALRLWYFGDVLPNTYYLKVTGIPAWMRLSRGAFVTLMFLLQVTPLVLLVAASARARNWRNRHAYLLSIFVMQLAYSAYVGGDTWEWLGGSNRFVSVAMPLLFVMVSTSFVRMLGRPTWLASASLLTIATAIGLNLLAFSTSGIAWKRILLTVRPLQNALDIQMVRAGLALQRTTDPHAVVAVTWAGAIPYFSERPAIDLLGKVDRHVAREPMHLPVGEDRWTRFIPGHLKWDYSYSIALLRPDVIQAPLWTLKGVEGNELPSLAGGYAKRTAIIDWYVRTDSPYVKSLLTTPAAVLSRQLSTGVAATDPEKLRDRETANQPASARHP